VKLKFLRGTCCVDEIKGCDAIVADRVICCIGDWAEACERIGYRGGHCNLHMAVGMQSVCRGNILNL
jgi:hypothetical protein